MRYATLGRRIAARLIDTAILISVVFLVVLIGRLLMNIGVWGPLAHAANTGQNWDPMSLWKSLPLSGRLSISFAYFLSSGPIYFVLCHASPWQATIGKRLLDICVTDEGGNRIGIPCSFKRWITEWILNLFFASDFLCSTITILLSKKHKALHDFLPGTLVVRGMPVGEGELQPWKVGMILGIPAVWMLITFSTIFG